MEQVKNEIALQTTIQKWNYQKSISIMQKKVAQWQELTVEIARELYIAHKNLTTQKGQYKDPTADDYIAYTWVDYCTDIGISKSTVRRWLKLFIPAELSENGEDRLLTAEELKQEQEAQELEDFEASERRIAIYQKTGKRPENWTPVDERKIRLREAEKKAKALADKWSDKAPAIKPRKDYFQEILEISSRTRARRFTLATQEQHIVQERTFIALDQNLSNFDDYETRLIAAVNLQERLKKVVNSYAEEQITKAEEQTEKKGGISE